MKNTTYCLALSIFLLLCSVNSIAQKKIETEPDETYKIYTHTFVGSNNEGNGKELSGKMAKVFAAVKNNYKYTNYQLLLTQFQLIKRRGSISYKSILKSSDYTGSIEAPIFASWVYKDLDKEMLNGKKQIGFKSFRFDMRFPVKSITTNKNKETISTFNYESVYLSAQTLDFPMGEPIIFASLPIDFSDKTLFFVAQVEEVN